MNRRALSSRATGPKIRVPIGSLSLSMRNLQSSIDESCLLFVRSIRARFVLRLFRRTILFLAILVRSRACFAGFDKVVELTPSHPPAPAR